MSYIDTLILNCHQAKAAVPTEKFIMNSLDDLNNVKQAIYIIREIEGDRDRTFLEFTLYKQMKARACAKRNCPSPVLYIGSTTGGVKKRILQHMGDGPSGTYALHLKHWFKGNYEIEILVYDVTPAVLQIIEDDLSHQLNPAFGKKGGNNK